MLPWDHLDSGLDKDWLWEDWQDALDETEVDDCRWTPCFDCGVCPQMGTEIQVGPTGQDAAAADGRERGRSRHGRSVTSPITMAGAPRGHGGGVQGPRGRAAQLVGRAEAVELLDPRVADPDDDGVAGTAARGRRQRPQHERVAAGR